jgi:hypothetical protein
MRLPFTLFFVAALTACAPFPELDAVGPDTAIPPQLLPLDTLLAQGTPQGSDPGPALSARAARLKARAAAISSAPPAP